MAGLYIHVPFCHAKCAYCDFYSRPTDKITDISFAELIRKEFQLRQPEIEDIKTIYFGGGTPSILPLDQVEAFAAFLPNLIGKSQTEFTVEFNPEDATNERLEMWRDLGADRVSMGIQSFNDSELKAIGRRHTAADAISAYERLRTTFDNISIDLIVGLPGQTLDSLRQNLMKAVALRPEHISVYILSYEPGTRLWAMRQTGKITETDDDTIATMYAEACAPLSVAGYSHYEISNFALPGKEALHNSSYWSGEPYLGLGPSAHSYGNDSIRRYNPNNYKLWSEKIASGQTAFVTETETPAEKTNNIIMTRL